MDQLGPFQEMWKAWNEVHDDLMSKPLSHFERSIEVQFEEMREHLAAGNNDGAAREAIDVVCIGLNCLRRLGLQPEDIARFAQARAENRMRGRTREILDKYQRLYGI